MLIQLRSLFNNDFLSRRVAILMYSDGSFKLKLILLRTRKERKHITEAAFRIHHIGESLFDFRDRKHIDGNLGVAL
jgi:hypothetical protein